MSAIDDIWKRYDQKVIETQAMGRRIDQLEALVDDVKGDRDRWVETCKGLKQKLISVRSLAEKLAETPTSSVLMQFEQDLMRARGVIGLILVALGDAWREEELAWKASSQGGGKLLQSITAGGLAVVPTDGYIRREWLQKLDLDELRHELSLGHAVGELVDAGLLGNAEASGEIGESSESSEIKINKEEDAPQPRSEASSSMTFKPVNDSAPSEASDIRPFRITNVKIVHKSEGSGPHSSAIGDVYDDEIDVDVSEEGMEISHSALSAATGAPPLSSLRRD